MGRLKVFGRLTDGAQKMVTDLVSAEAKHRLDPKDRSEELLEPLAEDMRKKWIDAR